MQRSEDPVCPACGFQVFNRRYPKCESCGVELPDSLVYDATERKELLESEVQRLDAEHAEHKAAAARAEATANAQLAKTALVLSLLAVAGSSGR